MTQISGNLEGGKINRSKPMFTAMDAYTHKSKALTEKCNLPYPLQLIKAKPPAIQLNMKNKTKNCKIRPSCFIKGHKLNNAIF